MTDIPFTDDLTGDMRYSILAERDLSDEQVEQAMIDEIDRVLDHPERRRVPAGTLLTEEGLPLDGITILLEGRVRLFRCVQDREIVFHHRTAGRIIGLLGLARALPASFSTSAETDLTVLPLTMQELDAALRRSPTLTMLFASALVRSLARRNLRSIEQQLELREFAQSRIEEAERLAIIGQLAADVAHELNNPLQGIVAYAHLLLERIPDDDPNRDVVERITVQADRSRGIIRSLLDYSRPREPQKRATDLNAVVRESLNLVEGQALFLNIDIRVDLDPGMELVMADPGQVQQVIMNLIINAAEAMEGSGRLAIATGFDHSAKVAEVRVSDNGPGIPEEHRARVFDPFFSTKAAMHGTGLGLAISHGIVGRHRGTISVESEPGVGTTFSVRLPGTAEWPLESDRADA